MWVCVTERTWSMNKWYNFCLFLFLSFAGFFCLFVFLCMRSVWIRCRLYHKCLCLLLSPKWKGSWNSRGAWKNSEKLISGGGRWGEVGGGGRIAGEVGIFKWFFREETDIFSNKRSNSFVHIILLLFLYLHSVEIC